MRGRALPRVTRRPRRRAALSLRALRAFLCGSYNRPPAAPQHEEGTATLCFPTLVGGVGLSFLFVCTLTPPFCAALSRAAAPHERKKKTTSASCWATEGALDVIRNSCFSL